MSALILPWDGLLPKIGADVFVAPNATLIGDLVIGAQSSVWFNVVIRGDVNEIRIGARTNVQDGTVVHATKQGSGTFIGDDVTIGHSAVLHACTLEDGAFVGMGAIILDNAVVEGGAMVAAGAVVPPGKRVPRGELWAGSPARCLRKLSEDEQADLRKTAAQYVGYAAQYLQMLSRSPGR